MTTRVITVYGATGNQGRAVTVSLLKNPAFHVRALTRNPDSIASTSLAALGAEIRAANGLHSETMVKAFEGSWGVFVNLNSDDKVFQEGCHTEFDVGKTIVDAAVQAGVRHFVFSSGPSSTELTDGRIKMKAMDMKNQIELYARRNSQFETTSFICAAWYFENFLDMAAAPIFGGFPFTPDLDGTLIFRCPRWGGREDVPFISISDDYGDIVHGLFLDPARWNGARIHGCSDILSFDDLVAQFQAATGKTSRYDPIEPSWEAFETFGVPELEDTKLMFGLTQNTGGLYFGPEPSEKNTAATLKRATAIALGLPKERQGLISAKEWFTNHFST
ncbi:NmrA/HSCARG family protein [Aspergillus undulatus]|uniref:NmrA/HSCARG family protein n=1 Tax=Aspergillus undulatus TaxID=1810928 RepID=UPI003CCDB5D8